MTVEVSVDDGFNEDVMPEAAPELAQIYEKNCVAALLPAFDSSAPRYLIADETAKRIFFAYLA